MQRLAEEEGWIRKAIQARRTRNEGRVRALKAMREERKARRELCWGVEGWGETVHKTVPLIQTMRSRVLVPMPWSPVA